MNFNPRSPHGERQKRNDLVARGLIFQSTLPARGATVVEPIAPYVPSDFNPRSPHGERRLTIKRTKKSFKFQSTLPARGATSLANLKKGKRFGFQSTLPARGATEILRDFTKAEDKISIHAPRTGSDEMCCCYSIRCRFQSTLPARGATSLANLKKGKRFGFQSTLPARGATEILRDFTKAEDKISIHAPRTGSDEMCCCYSIRCRFQSTLPARGATFLVRKQL